MQWVSKQLKLAMEHSKFPFPKKDFKCWFWPLGSYSLSKITNFCNLNINMSCWGGMLVCMRVVLTFFWFVLPIFIH